MQCDEKLRSTQQSTNYMDYNNPYNVNCVAQRFLEHFCYISISLKRKGENSNFYYTESKEINELLQLNYGMSDYDFDSVIRHCIYDLLVYGKAYIERVLYFNNEEKLCKISFVPIRYKKMFKVFNKLYYTIKKFDDSREYGFINCKNLVELSLKDVGYRKKEFRKLFKKMGKNESMYNTLMFDKQRAGDFQLLKSRKNYKTLKINRKTFWTEDAGNEYISEPYLIYRNMQFDLLQKKFLDYVLSRINLSLERTGKEYSFMGKINCRVKTEKYDEYMEKLKGGQMNCEELCKLIF